MRIHAERARKYMGTRSLEEFLSDDMVQAAVIRCVEVVGEAARQVSEDARRRAPGIPWAQTVGMRNILAHDYGAVDLERVYSVVTEDLPELLEHINKLISSLEKELDWREDGDE
jgi:uncharacterized protein with HEPN domain